MRTLAMQPSIPVVQEGAWECPPQRLDRLTAVVMCTPLIGATLLSKFAIPPFGAKGVSIVIPLLLIAAATGFLTRRLTISPQRLAAYLILIGLLGAFQLFRAGPISKGSFVVLAALHVPYVLTLAEQRELGSATVDFFLKLARVIAWCAIAQFVLKSFVPVRYLFPIENFVPHAFVVQQFNEQGVIEYGSQLYRSNGVFMLEPSFCSQLLAVAVMVELGTLSRFRHLAIYALGMLVTYAGTGFLILGVCVPIFVIQSGRWSLLLIGAVAIAALAVGGSYLHLDRFIARAHEFNSVGSSGFARFVGGFYLFKQFLWNDPVRALVGFGAGSFKAYALRAHWPVAEMALTKLIFEYGLIGTAAYFGFLLYCLTGSTLPRPAVVAVALTMVLNGIYTPFAHGLALSLLVWTGTGGARSRPRLPPVTPDAPAASCAGPA
jgi:hypothetical protein